jgi:DNA-binding LytR/AlgR family response regulator
LHLANRTAVAVEALALAPFSLPATAERSLGDEGGRAGRYESPLVRVAARTRQGLVFLGVDDVLAFEAKDRLYFVHSSRGRFDVDLSLVELEGALGGDFLRIHRNWLVPASKIHSLETDERSHWAVIEDARERPRATLRAPVSRELIRSVRARLLAGSIGLRSKERHG